MRISKYAVTLSNKKIVYPNATSEIQARAKIEAAIAEKDLDLKVESVRKI